MFVPSLAKNCLWNALNQYRLVQSPEFVSFVCLASASAVTWPQRHDLK